MKKSWKGRIFRSKPHTFLRLSMYSAVFFFALILSACGGGSNSGGGGSTSSPGTVGSGGGGTTGGGGGSTTGAVASLVIATTNTSNDTILSSFTYTSSGTLTAPSTPNTLTIPPSGSTCSGVPVANSYDKPDGLLFIAFNPSSSTITICSYQVSPTTGTISSSISNINSASGSGFVLDTINKVILVTQNSGGTIYSYTYSSNGNISSTANTLNTSPIPTGNSPINGDFANQILWYGTTSGGNNTIVGTCKLTFSSGSYSLTSCGSISNSITVPQGNTISFGSDGVLIYDNSPSNCNGTSVSAYINIYSTTTGNFSTTNPASTSIGTCANIAYIGGNNGDVSADLTKDLFFAQANGSSNVTAYSFSVTPPGSFGSNFSGPLSNQTSGLYLENVNDFIVYLNGSNTSSGSGSTTTTITGATFLPYTSSSFGTASTVSPTLSSSTFTCPNSGNCTYGVFAFIN